MVDLDDEAVDEALEVLEDGMEWGETAVSHEKMRPSTHMMVKDIGSAYRTLVEAHPDYDLTEGEA